MNASFNLKFTLWVVAILVIATLAMYHIFNTL